MILLVFLNEHDKNSQLLGRQLPDYLVGDYAKIFARFNSNNYEKCPVEQTMSKIKEYTQVFDKIIVSFGLRIFPVSVYKEIIDKYKNTDKNIVFLKRLKGSKTWSIVKGKLKFDNNRIADTGLFILQAKDVNDSNATNFNSFLRELISKDKLNYEFVPYWVLTNSIRTIKRIKSKIRRK